MNNIEKRIFDYLISKGYEIKNMNDNFIVVNNVTSIEFVSLIVDVEAEYNICIPDEYLDYDSLNTAYKLSEVVKKQINH